MPYEHIDIGSLCGSVLAVYVSTYVGICICMCVINLEVTLLPWLAPGIKRMLPSTFHEHIRTQSIIISTWAGY